MARVENTRADALGTKLLDVIFDFYEENAPHLETNDFVDEASAVLATIAVQMTLSHVPRDYHRYAIANIQEIVAAARLSIEAGISLGTAAARIRGVKLQ